MESGVIGKVACSVGSLTQLRRRESDARWRANLANCYDTLKNVIPINKRACKKQVSKAFILESTSKHLYFLEKLLIALLEHDVLSQQIESDQSAEWVSARVKGIKEEFMQCYIPYIQAAGVERKSKRKRSVDLSPSAVVPSCSHIAKNNRRAKTVTTRKRTPKRRVVKFVRLKKALSVGQVESLTMQDRISSSDFDASRAVMIEVSRRSDQVIIKQPLLAANGRRIIKVFKVNKAMLNQVLNVNLDDYFGKKSNIQSTENEAAQCVPHEEDDFSTEVIASNFPDLDLSTIDPETLAEVLGPAIFCSPEKNADGSDSPCFTPIKLPSFDEIKPSKDSKDESLLCTEWMWQSDDEEDNRPHEGSSPSPAELMRRNESTPSIHPKPKNLFHPKRREPNSQEPGTQSKDMSARPKKARTGKKCRKSLKSMFAAETTCKNADIVSFDGYLAFYHHERACMEESSIELNADVSTVIREKWCSLSDTQRNVYMKKAEGVLPKVKTFLPLPEQEVVETWEEFESDFGILPDAEGSKQEVLCSPVCGYHEVPSLSPHMNHEIPQSKDLNCLEDTLIDDDIVPSIEGFEGGSPFAASVLAQMSPLFDYTLDSIIHNKH